MNFDIFFSKISVSLLFFSLCCYFLRHISIILLMIPGDGSTSYICLSVFDPIHALIYSLFCHPCILPSPSSFHLAISHRHQYIGGHSPSEMWPSYLDSLRPAGKFGRSFASSNSYSLRVRHSRTRLIEFASGLLFEQQGNREKNFYPCNRPSFEKLTLIKM